MGCISRFKGGKRKESERGTWRTDISVVDSVSTVDRERLKKKEEIFSTHLSFAENKRSFRDRGVPRYNTVILYLSTKEERKINATSQEVTRKQRRRRNKSLGFSLEFTWNDIKYFSFNERKD